MGLFFRVGEKDSERKHKLKSKQRWHDRKEEGHKVHSMEFDGKLVFCDGTTSTTRERYGF